eukprot:6489913-Prymnesium_polylepis.1
MRQRRQRRQRLQSGHRELPQDRSRALRVAYGVKAQSAVVLACSVEQDLVCPRVQCLEFSRIVNAVAQRRTSVFALRRGSTAAAQRQRWATERAATRCSWAGR